MKLESHATPYGGTPQQRYASLHRAIEKGLNSDDVWHELAIVSQALGNTQEAHRCIARVQDSSRRDALRSRLGHRKVKPRQAAQHATTGTPPADAAVAIAADANLAHDEATNKATGPAARAVPSVLEHLLDAAQYLLHQHMPWLVLTTMLAFPVLVGVGGVLTAGESPLLLLAMAALPGICVLTVLAAMGSAILRQSSQGEGDVPNVPEFGLLVRDGRDFMVDGLLVLLAFFATPATFVALGAPWSTAVPSLLIAVLLAPMAFALRHVRRDLRAFSPLVLLQAIRRCGPGYTVVAVAASAAFVPAALVTVAVCTRPIWVQIAIVGPLCVLPVFCAARLLGTFLDTHRKDLGHLLVGGNHGQVEQQQPLATVTEVRQPRRLRKPDALESFKAPKATRVVKSQRSREVRPASALARKRQPRAIEGRRPNRDPRAQDERPTTGKLPDKPNLDSMPGAFVVSGNERLRHGAASRRS